MSVKCRHCLRRLVSRPRRLCHACSGTPAIRALYPTSAPSVRGARRGVGHGNHKRPLPELATTALTGTEAKIAEMAERAAAEVALFHPEDCRMCGDGGLDSPVATPGRPKGRVNVAAMTGRGG